MAKLPQQYQFIDLSDYGRGIARWIANSLKNTSVTPIQVTTWFIIAGILAIIAMLKGYYIAAAILLVLKSILDAADGELSRVKNTPSYVGRYYDSIADIILNFLFLWTIMYICDGSFWMMMLAFVGIQLQGTLYNYYYVILRNNVSGDITSRVFEDSIPKAMKGESQSTVDLFYKTYNTLYIVFDKAIYYLDRKASDSRPFPKWFMTMNSIFGLGFQLLIMSVLLAAGYVHLVLPVLVGMTLLLPVFILIRRFVLK